MIVKINNFGGANENLTHSNPNSPPPKKKNHFMSFLVIKIAGQPICFFNGFHDLSGQTDV